MSLLDSLRDMKDELVRAGLGLTGDEAPPVQLPEPAEPHARAGGSSRNLPDPTRARELAEQLHAFDVQAAPIHARAAQLRDRLAHAEARRNEILADLDGEGDSRVRENIKRAAEAAGATVGNVRADLASMTWKLEALDARRAGLRAELDAIESATHPELRAALAAAKTRALDARRAVDQADLDARHPLIAMDEAERAFGADPTDDAWKAVLIARGARDRAVTHAGQLRRAATEADEAVTHAEQALAAAELDAARQAADPETFLRAVAPDVIEAVRLERELSAVWNRMLAAQRGQERAAVRLDGLGGGSPRLGADQQPTYLIGRAVHAARVARGETERPPVITPIERSCRGPLGSVVPDMGTAGDIIDAAVRAANTRES